MKTQTKYLYGAAVQGIQSFIFQTNELKDIIGASELVEQICTEFFKEFIGETGDIIVSAAGNIKCVFSSEGECRKAVREFPKKVMTSAPGITISEAVVKMEEGMEFGDAVELLEERLRAQRNKPFPSITTGLMCMERSRKTGLPAISEAGGDFIDIGTKRKREHNSWHEIKKGTSTTHRLYEKSLGLQLDKDVFAFNLEDMASDNSWLAVIHADGNGLGEVVSAIGNDPDKLKAFSIGLDNATTEASRLAFREMQDLSSISLDGNHIIPFRPVVLGGDDLTMICRADLALPFSQSFIRHFEEETRKMMATLKEIGSIPHDCLTACAGIAYIKSSYPFYYGYNLAEALCKRAKRDAKRENQVPAPSCIMFHKVQSSFVESFDKIAKKDLQPYEGHSFEFGPYYLAPQENRWTVDELSRQVKLLAGKAGNAVKSDIRQWMTFMSDHPDKAHQKSERVKAISKGWERELYFTATSGEDRDVVKVYPAYDMLVLHSISLSIKKKKQEETK